MNVYGTKAKELFLQGYNCAQAVVGAFAEDFNVDKDTLIMLASPFGGGMGRMREICGAFSGMLTVAGLKYGYADPKAHEEKTELYKFVQTLAAEFKAANGKDTLLCRELLNTAADTYVPEKRTEEYYKKRPCADIAATAAHIIGEYILGNKNI